MLIAHYPLNGDLKDYSGFNRDLKINYGTIDVNYYYKDDGVIGKCLYKKAAIFETTLKELSEKNIVSVSCWVRIDPNITANWGDIWNLPTTNSNGVNGAFRLETNSVTSSTSNINLADNTAYNIQSNPQGGGAGSYSVTTNEWHHYVVVKTKDRLMRYCDGIKHMDIALQSYGFFTGKFYLGEGNTGSISDINDIRIYNHGLSTKEVLNVYKTKILHYNFNNTYEEPTSNLMPLAVKECTGGIGSHYNGVITPNTIFDNRKCFKITTANNDYINDGFITNKTIDCTEGQTYTYSLWTWVPTGHNVMFSMRDITGGGGHFFKTITGNNKWNYVEVTFTATNNTSGAIQGYQSNGIATDIFSFYIRNLQLEKKDHAAPFTINDRLTTIKDCSGFQNDGTITLDTAPEWTKDSKFGDYSINTLNSKYISVTPLRPMNFTISMWIKRNSITGTRQFFWTQWYGFSMELNVSGQFYCPIYLEGNTTISATSNTVLNINQWYMITLVYNSKSGMSIYENGTLKGSASNNGKKISNTGTTSRIGNYSSNYFDGKIDDVRMYATALSSDDILNLYQTCQKFDKDYNIYSNEFVEVENSKIQITKNNEIKCNEFIENTFKPTLVDYSQWNTIGTGGIGMWSQNGSTNENQRMLYPNPYGQMDYVWATIGGDSTSDADGGWNAYNLPIDKTKKYRCCTWVKRDKMTNGSFYFGCQGNTVCNLNQTDTSNSNPYFWSVGTNNLYTNWILCVAYILPTDTVTTTTMDNRTGVYQLNGTFTSTGTNFKWLPTATTGGIRSYLYYSTSTTDEMYWYRPRFEVCDGSEPSIEELLKCSEHVPMVNIGKAQSNVISLNKQNNLLSNCFVEI